MGVRVVRAFNALLYRREKLRLANEAVQLQEQAAAQIRRLAELGRVGRGDLLLARSDVAEMHALRGPARTNLDQAAIDLRRLLGVLEDGVDVVGTLEAPVPPVDRATATQIALEQRPDLRAFRLAVEEAEARLRLEVANRYGNPSAGPAMEYNETRDTFVGLWLVWSLPVLNTRRGEIMQRQAERGRAEAAVRQAEFSVQQDVQAAVARLANAEATVSTFRKETLPTLREAREALDRLFEQGEMGVDVLRVLDVRRRLIRARDAYLDALWELNQARADLAAALGDPAAAYATTPIAGQ
jgi:outer membrane protein TolC